jgi:hypothetical protein
MALSDLQGKTNLQGKANLQLIKGADFLYAGKGDPGDWSNPVSAFKTWRNIVVVTFVVLVGTTIPGLLAATGDPHLHGLLWLAVQWVVALPVFGLIKWYLEEGVFEQRVRYAFKQARGTLTTEEWGLWLGRAYDLVKCSPVWIRRMNPWAFWVRGADNPEHFDWILDQLKKLGEFVHVNYQDPTSQRGANPALDRRYDDNLDGIIEKLDPLKARWMGVMVQILHITLIASSFGALVAAGALLELLGGTK